LLAGLSVAEIEAVLAHEMTHAKLINRGYRNWVWGAQARVRTLAQALWAEANAARRVKSPSNLALALFGVVHRLLRLCTRLVAAYSRQNEFEADRGAAELCGTEVMNSALSKSESLHRITSRLPWNERVAQLQQAGGYSQWLLQEIAQGAQVPSKDSDQVLFNKYSTHPSIQDRLAALPPDDKLPAPNSPSGIQLLSHPDNIAVKLLTELQRMNAEREQKDSEALEKFSRKTGRHANLRPLQKFGFLLILAGIFTGLGQLAAMDRDILIILCCPGLIVLGIITIRRGKYCDVVDLPVPAYERIMHPSAGKTAGENVEEKKKAIEAELSRRFLTEQGANRGSRLAAESYAALKNCDYLRAHIAARECLKFDKKSVEGALALAVASAAFAQMSPMIQLLAFVQKQTGFQTFSTTWGAAWAALLTGDWVNAEAMLEKALTLYPGEMTLVSLLAFAQFRRGKLQSAIVNARRACESSPGSTEKLKFLVARLLDGGFTREAQERMRRLDMESDPELMLCMAQIHLLQRQFDEADKWVERLKQSEAAAQMKIRLGGLYENARLPERAAALYEEALAVGHYPEACLGLGRIESNRNNKAEARRHILAALNVDRAVGKEGAGTMQILRPILAQMLSLNEPVPKCQAWIAAFPGKTQPAVMAGQSFMVYAPSLQQAQEYFRTMSAALQPGKPLTVLPENNWKSAPRPMQPHGPVRPGVQGLWR
jgi:tetratricopeptide (TPR) repeat protein